MKKPARLLLFWSPRILTMLFAAFTSIFALDVFDLGLGFWQTALGLLMHLLPTTGIVLAVLVLSWRWEWIGAVLFLALGVLYAIWAFSHLLWIAIIGGPLFLLGFLFLLGWLYRSEIRTT